jgi:hypothetical protein
VNAVALLLLFLIVLKGRRGNFIYFQGSKGGGISAKSPAQIHGPKIMANKQSVQRSLSYDGKSFSAVVCDCSWIHSSWGIIERFMVRCGHWTEENIKGASFGTIRGSRDNTIPFLEDCMSSIEDFCRDCR